MIAAQVIAAQLGVANTTTLIAKQLVAAEPIVAQLVAEITDSDCCARDSSTSGGGTAD